MSTNIQKRANFGIVKQMYAESAKTNPIHRDVRLSEGTLRFELPINLNTQTYRFPVLETDQIPGIGTYKSEIRLGTNDNFSITEFAIFYLIRNDITDATFMLTHAPWNAFAPCCLMTKLYDGTLTLDINKETRLYKYDLKRFNKYTETQYIGFHNNVTQPAPIGTFPYSTQPDVNFLEDGLQDVQPIITISGAEKTDIVVELPRALDGSQVTPGANMEFYMFDQKGTAVLFRFERLVFFARGILAQNAATFQTLKK